MRIFIIRHAESLRLAGQSDSRDSGLSEAGRRHAARLAEHLRAQGLCRILTSPYRRCLETAAMIQSAAGVGCQVWPDLHEREEAPLPADWPLMSTDRIAAEFPGFELWKAMPRTHWSSAPEDREHQWRRVARVLKAVLESAGTSPADVLAMVTHLSPAAALVQQFCQWTNPLDVRVQIDPGCFCELQIEPGGRRRLVRLNCGA
jgi:broad specificity phosphatase PhoE